MRARLSLIAAVVTLLVYWLTWSGVPHAVDELSALSVTESMAAGGPLTLERVRADQMEWDQRRTPPQNIRGLDDHLYSKKGLGVSLAALPLWVAGKQIDAIGPARMSFLAGAPLAALSVGALVWAALGMGYASGTALLGGFALGFGTLLWPYSRTLFSEAFAAPGLALALAGAVLARRSPQRSRAALLVSGIGLALLTLAKSSNAVVAPFVYLYVIAAPGLGLRGVVRALTWLSIPFGLAVLITVGYNYARFGTLLSFPLEPTEGFTTPLQTGLAGLLISPGKGLLWYVPLAWLALAGGACAMARRPRNDVRGLQRADALLALACVLAPVLFYALWFDWPGGRAWGPRMIAWVMPSLALLALPVLDRLADGRLSFTTRMVPGLILALSVIAQLPAVLHNFELREARDMAAGISFDALIWQADFSPLITYWRAAPSLPWRATIEPLILQPFTWQRPLIAAAFLILLAAALALLWGAARRRSMPLLATAALAVMAAGPVLAAAGRSDPSWSDRTANAEDNAALVEAIRTLAAPGDLIILDLREDRDATPRAWWRQQALPAPPAAVARIRSSDLSSQDAAAAERWLAGRSRAWLNMVETPEGDPLAGMERWLDARAYRGRSLWLGAQRLVEYLLPGQAVPVAEGSADDMGLTGFRVLHDPAQPFWAIDLEWTAPPASPDLRFSVQALDAAGALLAQVDRAPAALPEMRDQVGLSAPGAASILLKLYDAVTGAESGAPVTLFP